MGLTALLLLAWLALDVLLLAAVNVVRARIERHGYRKGQKA